MNAQITEEAAEWFITFRVGDGDLAERAEFAAWLRRGPEYVRAYIEVAAIWNEGAALDAGHAYSADELVRLARSDENVVEFAVVREGVASSTPSPSQWKLRPWSAAAGAAIVIIGVLAWMAWNHEVYRTGIGEQRSVVLDDGSTVQLNSRSRIRVRFSATERTLKLLEGQALFSVAKDAARPFVVQSGDIRVRAVGTQFDVYRRLMGTTVTVVEGKVEVRSSEASGARAPVIPLAAGEQVTVSPAALAQPVKADLATATAWTERRLMFDSAQLAEVAEEFNRYNVRQIVLMDADIEGFRVSGVFSSADPRPLIQFLSERQGIEVREVGNAIEIYGPGVSTH